VAELSLLNLLFRSAAEILQEFDLPRDGPHYRRLVDGLKRIFTSTIYFGTESPAGRQEVWESRRFHFFDRLRIWCNRAPDEEFQEQRAECNIIGLSESFWQEIQAHPIPSTIGLFESSRTYPAASTCG